MRFCLPVIAAAAAFTSLSALGQLPTSYSFSAEPLSAAERCSAVAELELPELTALEAARVPPGPFELPAQGPAPARSVNLPAFCRVRGTVAPAIRFEVWLPDPSAWNGRFEAVGGGGFAGVISYSAMAAALSAGYVTASTDTGHVSTDLEWLADDRRLRDYGYRGIFEMTAKAKTVTSAFYDRPADFNYFNGCSTGGRQGLMEAQRFPDDYDGVVSGAPVNYFVNTHFTQLWVALAAKPVRDEPNLTSADLELVNRAVLAQCDRLDGVADGVIEDPTRCNFDPGRLQCQVGASGQCLGADQVSALRRIYSGPRDPVSGARLHAGLAPGGETGWSLVTDDGLAPIPLEYFHRSVFADPAWDWRSFDFAADVDLARERTGAILDATDPNLSEFRDRGGKLILYHGWNDQGVFPEASVDYYENVNETLASLPNASGQRVDDFFRLFMVPGMMHCRGGPGTSQFDAQRAIEDWVERGIAPDRIEASRPQPTAEPRTRPLCPWPLRARYRGTGDTNRSSSFVCGV